jgi:hypothetical protein
MNRVALSSFSIWALTHLKTSTRANRQPAQAAQFALFLFDRNNPALVAFGS